MSNTKKIKGRLLYYYPPSGDGNKEGEKKNDDADTQEDGWIGWHNDSGFLTALTSDMYFDNTTGKEVPSPDAKAGLYIVDRDSNSIQVTIPNDELAVQCGECLQILTGGLLVATPHCVRAGRGLSPEGNPVGRVSFPVFVDTAMQFPLSSPEGVTREEVFTSTVTSKVPPLEKRWLKQKTPFVQFLGDTFKQYYEWSQKDK